MAVVVKTLNGLAYASVKTQRGLAVASIKSINGMDVTAGGGASISDDFNRADASTLGTTPVGSKTWASFFSTASTGVVDVGIESNRGFAKAASGDGNAYPYVATNSADIDVSITLSVIGSAPIYPGVIARIVDTNNLVLLQYDSDAPGASAYSAYKKVSGSYTLLGSSSGITPTDGDVLRLVVSGTDTVDFYINNTHFGPFTATGISSSSVNAGFMGGSLSPSNTSTARFDSFSVV